ncbi:dihydrofolate reductase [Tothia fuscella]|uniref:Dihydrofolate reductase n=1 Tax=Tothia fuscella TaxID=1048955 RepID=A0A9P4P2K1_9PEZI|nr:dihydrofolate reductase [Tothia fuscella]
MAPSTPTPTAKPIKILMLHGYTQSGPLFRSKTRALEKNLSKAFKQGIQLSYPTAPIRLFKSDIPNWDDPAGTASFESSNTGAAAEEEDSDSWGWWRRKGSSEPYTYEGIELGFQKVAQILREEGPFDGVIGFSQGGALAGMLASALEERRREAFEKAQSEGGMRFPESLEDDTGFVTDLVHPPLKFAVIYSGFGASTHALYKAFSEPQIRTPMLHFIGSVDTVVEEKRSLRLVDACVDGRKEGRLVYHPGGHFLPSSQRQSVAPLIGFIKKIMEGVPEKKEEESVEDMDVPF